MTNASDWVSNYTRGMAGASTAYTKGIQAVTDSPMIAAANAIDRMRSGVLAALDSGYTERRLRETPLQAYKDAATQKGAAALATAGKLAAPKVAKWAAIAAPIFANARAQIAAMPKGGRANAIARINAQLDAVDQAKTQYRASK